MTDNNKKIIRNPHLAENVVVIDGYRGCGKTLFGPIISSLERVEILNFAFEIEFICRLHKLDKITKDATDALTKMFIDHKLYQTMMGRETNFRYSDLSSVFNYSNPSKYFKRIFQEGDVVVPSRIAEEKPILSLTTHDLLAYSEPLFETLGNKLTFIEIVRHPLYMIIQETHNMKTLFEHIEPRDIQIYFDYNGKELPYFCHGWEELYLNSNYVEKAIYAIHHANTANNRARKEVKKYSSNLISIPFEKFVTGPDVYMNQIVRSLKSNLTKETMKALKKQKVPRKKIADGISLDVYKRFGWEPSQKGFSEEDELNKRREFVIKEGASKEALALMDSLSNDYEEKLKMMD